MLNNKNKPKILFIHQSWKGFEKRDFEILKKNFITKEILIYKNFLYKSFYAIKILKKIDIVFCWFAYRSALLTLLFAKLFRKKIIIIAGGWECADAPYINYGNMRKGIKFLFNRLITKYIFIIADKIVVVSEYNKSELIKNVGITEDKIVLIYNGVPINCCNDQFEIFQKEEFVLTVGEINKENMKRKGLEVFINVAKLLPEIKFIIVGEIDKKLEYYLKRSIPNNLKLLGFINEDILHTLYRKAKVYAQLSYHEQFGCSLAEAMFHRCVPVITDKAALPEIVDKAGYYVPYGDIEKTAKAIKLALKDIQKGELARRRIIELFSLQKREEALVRLINEIWK